MLVIKSLCEKDGKIELCINERYVGKYENLVVKFEEVVVFHGCFNSNHGMSFASLLVAHQHCQIISFMIEMDKHMEVLTLHLFVFIF